jgi:predicted phosphohydrolase
MYEINDYRAFYENMFKFVKYEDVLIFAGDIYTPQSIKYKYFILDYLSSFTHHTIFVAGNHEYYNSSIKKTNTHFQRYDDEHNNFTFLNNSSVFIEDVEILGGTMWSNIGQNYTIQKSISDFRLIEDLTLDKINRLYNEFEYYLFEKFKVNSKYTRIVVTHFQPSIETVQLMHKGSTINSYFNSGILDKRLAVDLNPKWWIYGHDHCKVNEVKINEINVITNQFGYYHRYYNNAVPTMKTIEI